MTDNVYLNKNKTAVVSEFTIGKKFQVSRAEAVSLGLLDSPDKPIQERRTSNGPLRTVEKVGPTAPQKRRSAPRKKKA